jgi:hypothetical protein
MHYLEKKKPWLVLLAWSIVIPQWRVLGQVKPLISHVA